VEFLYVIHDAEETNLYPFQTTFSFIRNTERMMYNLANPIPHKLGPKSHSGK